MAKQKKVMDIRDGGCHLEVICFNDRRIANPYQIRLIRGGHKNVIAAYGDWMSVLYFMRDFYLEGMDTRTLQEIKEWWRKGFGE